MKVLITGGAGFIGSHLADRLVARGDEVLVIDNYATGRRDNLASHRLLTVVEGTIVDTRLVDKAFEEFQPDMVVHAAASYKDPDNWTEDALTNVVGTANVIQASKHQASRASDLLSDRIVLWPQAIGATDYAYPSGSSGRQQLCHQ